MWNILLPAIILAGIGFVLGVLIYIVGKVFYVEEDPSIEEVVELLPKYNCGACGYPGCKEPELCKPMKKEDLPAIKDYLKKYFEKKNNA